MNQVKRVAILGGSRIPFCRSMGKYMGLSNQELMVPAINEVVAKFGLQGQKLGEVSLGAVMKHSSDWNMAREITLSTNLASSFVTN